VKSTEIISSGRTWSKVSNIWQLEPLLANTNRYSPAKERHLMIYSKSDYEITTAIAKKRSKTNERNKRALLASKF